MGNIARYAKKCEVDSEYMSICQQLKQHKLKMHFIDTLGRALESMIFKTSEDMKNLNFPATKDSKRLSPYQVLGHLFKRTGDLLDDNDGCKKFLILLGRTEKVYGQIENELMFKLNRLLLEPIQLIRCYHREEILPLSIRLGIKVAKSENSLNKDGSVNSDETSDDSLLDYQDSTVNKIKTYESLLEFKLKECNDMMMELRSRLLAFVDTQLETLMSTITYLKDISAVAHSDHALENFSRTFLHLNDGSTIEDYSEISDNYRSRIYSTDKE